MPNGKRNYILVTYESDSDSISIDKLYCTKAEAKAYMAHEMYEWIKEQYEWAEDIDCCDNAWISDGETGYVEYYSVVQFDDWHVTMELIRTKLVEKTEIEERHLNDAEIALFTEGHIFPNGEDDKYDWETGMRK